MSTTENPVDRAEPIPSPTPAPPVYFDARAEFSARYLFGSGIEIGPLHQPLSMPPHASVRYVDRLKVADLRREYPELADWNLTEVDLVDDGEALSTIADGSQDFIVANHFLEHCENPIRTIETHLGKLKPGGVLFYAVPDRRYTFDFRRTETPLEHMVADYEEGPEHSRKEHYDDWARRVIDGESPHAASGDDAAQERWTEAKARELEAAKYSIHMHVWTQAEFLKLILHCRERSGGAFDLEAAARQAIEFVVILRKSGPFPVVPPGADGPPEPAEKGALRSLASRARRAVGSVRAEVRRRRARP